MRPLAQSETAMTIAAPLAVGLVIVALWEIVCRSAHVPVFLFPKPSDVALKLASDWPSLLAALWMTLRVALQAFISAIVVGVLIAFCSCRAGRSRRASFPTRSCCRSRRSWRSRR
jgi:NitT/TauT family transport system permease protein